jgi:hypothetical protein
MRAIPHLAPLMAVVITIMTVIIRQLSTSLCPDTIHTTVRCVLSLRWCSRLPPLLRLPKLWTSSCRPCRSSPASLLPEQTSLFAQEVRLRQRDQPACNAESLQQQSTTR